MPVIYRAVTDTTKVGLSAEGEVIAGIRLELVEADEYDCLADEIANIGADALIHLPEGGLIPGQLYEPRVTNLKRDLESGYIDEWDITLYPCSAPEA